MMSSEHGPGYVFPPNHRTKYHVQGVKHDSVLTKTSPAEPSTITAVPQSIWEKDPGLTQNHKPQKPNSKCFRVGFPNHRIARTHPPASVICLSKMLVASGGRTRISISHLGGAPDWLSWHHGARSMSYIKPSKVNRVQGKSFPHVQHVAWIISNTSHDIVVFHMFIPGPAVNNFLPILSPEIKLTLLHVLHTSLQEF